MGDLSTTLLQELLNFLKGLAVNKSLMIVLNADELFWILES